MANTNKNSNIQEQDVEVLYQKLGDKWFAFSIINEEVFMAPISEEKIIEIKSEKATNPRSYDHEAA